MSPSPEITAAASLQDDASQPDVSAFVQANAGAGKTHVLVARVIRLLLQGVRPQRILCLTYTRAAAAEMSERLFGKLSGWIALSDDGLIDEIHKDAGSFESKEIDLALARRLFTSALETPGGLKVQTIHAFCERLLQRFPIEAGVVPGFKVISEQDSRDFMGVARAHVLTREDDKTRQAVSVVVRFANEQSLVALLKELKTKAHQLLVRYGTDNTFSQLQDHLGQVLGLSANETPEYLLAAFEKTIAHLDLARVLAALRLSDKDTDVRQATTLSTMLSSSDSQSRLASASRLSVTGKGEPKKDASLMTKVVSDQDPGTREILMELRDLTVPLNDKFIRATMATCTKALVHIGLETIKTYSALKLNQSAYDFEDLIHQTVDLLRNNADAAWVLYKLDGGLDHILIDEAQDTSPEQWDIINALTDEFFSGEGARPDMSRTMFAVGDRKQSIYSFQGADPKKFDEQAQGYKAQVENAELEFREVQLNHSFRSSELVLAAVDRVFKREDASKGVTSDVQTKVSHLPTRIGEKGLIEIWNLEYGSPDEAVDHWSPKTVVLQDPPHLTMARRIATTIKRWTQQEPLEMLDNDHKVQSGDILILVRERSYLMAAIVRALKEAGVPVAGADRLKLLDHIAVQDLMALAQACILPDDDLNFAGVLKSPLLTHDDGVTRFDDDDLFGLAYKRVGNLWQRLNEAAATGKPYEKAGAKLACWRNLATRSGVYEFYAMVLSRDGGRKAMLGGLGPEAADPIDAFLQLCLDYEQQHTPSLAGFLAWLEATEADIKRDMDMSGGEVRVMTVHGAKGLEAPIVFLPDTCSVPTMRKVDKVQFTDTDVPLWTLKAGFSTSLTDDLKAGAHENTMEEYNRLLYVAMTRARYRLYVCGFLKGEEGKTEPDESWYAMMLGALTEGDVPLLSQEIDDEGRTLWRAGEPKVARVKEGSGAKPVVAVAPPEWTRQIAAPLARPQRWLVPSRMDVAGEADDGWSNEVALSPLTARTNTLFRRGTLVHRLLQTLPDLPANEREAAARRYLLANGEDKPRTEATIAEIMVLFSDERFASVFSPAGRAEVSIAAMIDLPDQQQFGLTGQIDRLLVDRERVLVVDFKTNRPPPSELDGVPEIYLRQLAAYKRALEKVYPGRQVECALLWTDAPSLMPVPADMLDKAWAAAFSAPV